MKDHSLAPATWARTERLQLARADGQFHAGLCLARPPWPDLKEVQTQFLHPDEREYFSRLKFERRQLSYLTGRYCAKQALRQVHPTLSPPSISIFPGVFHQPVVQGAWPKTQVSISHTAEWGVALAFPEAHPMGIDLEEIRDERASAIRTQISTSELAIMTPLGVGELETLTLLWTIKEAMAKTIRSGMMTPFSVFEIASAERAGQAIRCTFVNFAQYKALAYLLPALALTLVGPKQSEFGISLPIQFHD